MKIIGVRTVLQPDTIEYLSELNSKRTRRWRRSKNGRAWYARNREQKLAYLKQWRASNPDKVVAQNIRRMEREFNENARTDSF